MTPAKRAFDVAASAAGVVVLAPVFLLVGLLVVTGDRGSPFFRQERVGRRGVPFRIWKFRTMAQRKGQGGPEVTAADDARITSVGRLLRRLKVDELPQLFNVLRGEMSIVGPRPEVPRFVEQYSPAERALLEFVPGLTDPASLLYHGEEAMLAGAADPERLYVERIMPAKARLSIDYARQATVRSDLRIILATLAMLCRPASRNASPASSPVAADRPFTGVR